MECGPLFAGYEKFTMRQTKARAKYAEKERGGKWSVREKIERTLEIE